LTKLIIHAVNVHRGGGAVLLLELLRSIPADVQVFVNADDRMKFPEGLLRRVDVWRCEPTIWSRFAAELRLARMTGSNDKVLCFGNLPPLFKLRGAASVFLQNRYLVDSFRHTEYLPLKMRFRIMGERLWLRWFRHRAANYFVQTQSMRRMTEASLRVRTELAPFAMPVSGPMDESKGRGAAITADYLYVASGEEHKNHKALLDAWRLLAEEGLYPTLALTLEETVWIELIQRIESECHRTGMRIINIGLVPHDQLREIYRQSGALIYPSLFESFGLPLIEAAALGLPLLAGELDYVRDVVEPEETFDPHSSISIARAVKRHMKKHKPTFEPITARALITRVLEIQWT
jgi:glycosyltransferase involved in cell wall biosynthesis